VTVPKFCLAVLKVCTLDGWRCFEVGVFTRPFLKYFFDVDLDGM